LGGECSDEMGLLLFTWRSGRLPHLQRDRNMRYAEKILISLQN